MTLGLRMRASLVVRMVAAIAVLVVVTVPVVLTAVVVSGLLATAAVGVVVGVLVTTVIAPLTGFQVAVPGGLLTSALPVVVGAGILLVPFLYLRPVREEIAEFRAEMRQSGTLAEERHPEVAGMARRLAQGATIPEPDVYIVNRRRPESYALGGRADGTVVVTRGVVRALSDDQLEAVLAHEISHLANGDSRIMHLALVPMLVAEHVGSTQRPDWFAKLQRLILPLVYLVHLLGWTALTAVTTVQYQCCRLGVTFLSRGRELAADRSAARLTGSPGALAGALETLDDERGTPGEDKRTWGRTAGTLDILPHESRDASWRLFRTHPDTETRIEHLERLATEMERGRD